MNSIKPPVSYYGGKTRMSHNIISLIPPHQIYIEPFFGGGSVFFSKPFPNVTNIDDFCEVINDKDETVINFYRIFQNQNINDELIRKIENTPYSIIEFKLAKQIIKNKENYNNVDLAWAFFINQSMAFGSIGHGGWGYSTYPRNHPVHFKNKFDRLNFLKERLNQTYIECGDAVEIIKKWDSKKSFFYCDPPYVGTDQGAYSVKYTEEDLYNLCKTLDNIDGSFILSSYNHKILEEFHWEKFEFESNCSATADKETGAGSRKEIVFRMVRESDSDKKLINKMWAGKEIDYKSTITNYFI